MTSPSRTSLYPLVPSPSSPKILEIASSPAMSHLQTKHDSEIHDMIITSNHHTTTINTPPHLLSNQFNKNHKENNTISTHHHDFTQTSSLSSFQIQNGRQTPTRNNQALVEKENESHESATRTSSIRNDPNHVGRRSILRRSVSARITRPSVSFAKQKEVMTFTAEDDRLSIESSEDVDNLQVITHRLLPEIQRLPLSPVSEKNAESSKGSEGSASPNKQDPELLDAAKRAINGSPSIYLHTFETTQPLFNAQDDDNCDNPFDTPSSPPLDHRDWVFPEIGAGNGDRKSKRSSVMSSPGVFCNFVRMSIGSETSSAGAARQQQTLTREGSQKEFSSVFLRSDHDNVDQESKAALLSKPEDVMLEKQRTPLSSKQQCYTPLSNKQQCYTPLSNKQQCYTPLSNKQQCHTPLSNRKQPESDQHEKTLLSSNLEIFNNQSQPKERQPFVPADAISSIRCSALPLSCNINSSSAASIRHSVLPVRDAHTMHSTLINDYTNDHTSEEKDHSLPDDDPMEGDQLNSKQKISMLTDDDIQFDFDLGSLPENSLEYCRTSPETSLDQSMTAASPFPPPNFSLFSYSSTYNDDNKDCSNGYLYPPSPEKNECEIAPNHPDTHDTSQIDRIENRPNVTDEVTETVAFSKTLPIKYKIPRISLSGVHTSPTSAERRSLPKLDVNDLKDDNEEDEVPVNDYDNSTWQDQGINSSLKKSSLETSIQQRSTNEIRDRPKHGSALTNSIKDIQQLPKQPQPVPPGSQYKQISCVAQPMTLEPQQSARQPLSFRTPRVVSMPTIPSLPLPVVNTGDQSQDLMRQPSNSSFYTPRTTARMRGPFSITEEGIRERLEDGTERITPRPNYFDPINIRLSTAINNLSDIQTVSHIKKTPQKSVPPTSTELDNEILQPHTILKPQPLQQERMPTLHEEDESDATNDNSVMKTRQENSSNSLLRSKLKTRLRKRGERQKYLDEHVPSSRPSSSARTVQSLSDLLPPINLDTPSAYGDDCSDGSSDDDSSSLSFSPSTHSCNKTSTDSLNDINSCKPPTWNDQNNSSINGNECDGLSPISSSSINNENRSSHFGEINGMLHNFDVSSTQFFGQSCEINTPVQSNNKKRQTTAADVLLKRISPKRLTRYTENASMKSSTYNGDELPEAFAFSPEYVATPRSAKHFPIRPTSNASEVLGNDDSTNNIRFESPRFGGEDFASGGESNGTASERNTLKASLPDSIKHQKSDEPQHESDDDFQTKTVKPSEFSNSHNSLSMDIDSSDRTNEVVSYHQQSTSTTCVKAFIYKLYQEMGYSEDEIARCINEGSEDNIDVESVVRRLRDSIAGVTPARCSVEQKISIKEERTVEKEKTHKKNTIRKSTLEAIDENDFRVLIQEQPTTRPNDKETEEINREAQELEVVQQGKREFSKRCVRTFSKGSVTTSPNRASTNIQELVEKSSSLRSKEYITEPIQLRNSLASGIGDVNYSAEGLTWYEFVEAFCDGFYSINELDSRISSDESELDELVKETFPSFIQDDADHDSHVVESQLDWTAEELVKPERMDKILGYLGKKIAIIRERIVSRGGIVTRSGKRCLANGNAQNFASVSNEQTEDYLQTPPELAAMYLMLPDSKAENGKEQLEKFIKDCWHACMVQCKQEAWVEVLKQVYQERRERINEIKEQIEAFPVSDVARILDRLCQEYQEKPKETEQKVCLFKQYINEQREWSYIKSMLNWKLNIKCQQQNRMNEKLKQRLEKIILLCKRTQELRALQQREKEAIEAETEQIKKQSSLHTATKQAIEQLKESVAFEKTLVEKSEEKTTRRKEIIKQLHESIERDKTLCDKLGEENQNLLQEVRETKSIIRWAATEKDLLEGRQRTKGYLLKRPGFDSIELEVIPKLYFNKDTQLLWDNYLTSQEVLMQLDISDEEEFDRLYDLWEMRRRKFIEDSLELELQQKLDKLKEPRCALLHLTVPTAPLIRIWWRYEVDDENVAQTDENVAHTDENAKPPLSNQIILFEGMRVELTSQLCDDLYMYIPLELRQLQPDYDLAQIDLDDFEFERIRNIRKDMMILKRRFIAVPEFDLPVTLCVARIMFEWQTRRCLFKFAETRLNTKISEEMKNKGFCKPSPINQYLNPLDDTSEAQDPIPIEMLSPQFPASMITDMIALCILHVRCIECLMEQQQELLSKYPPRGQFGGAEVTYIPKGTPYHDYRRIPPNGPLYYADDDEVVFSIVLLNRSMNKLSKAYPAKVTVIIACNVAFSMATKTWLGGTREARCSVMMDKKIWHLTEEEIGNRKNIRDQMEKALLTQLREYKKLHHLPTPNDLANVITTVEVAGEFVP